jgi:hypothetical protein
VIVVIALPIAYWSVAHQNLSASLAFKAQVKATALDSIVTANPALWVYEEHRLSELLLRYPTALDSERHESSARKGASLPKPAQSRPFH